MQTQKIRWTENEWSTVIEAIPGFLLQHPGISLVQAATKVAACTLPSHRHRPVGSIPPHVAQAIYTACANHNNTATTTHPASPQPQPPTTMQEESGPVIEVEAKVINTKSEVTETGEVRNKDDVALEVICHPDRYSIFGEVSTAVATEVLQERLHLGSANQLQALKDKPPTATEWIASFMWIDLQRKKKETKPMVMILGMREHQWKSIVCSLDIHEDLNKFMGRHLQLVLSPDSGNPRKEDYCSPDENIGQIYIAHGIPSVWFDLFYNDQSWDRSKVKVTTFREKDIVVEALKVINKKCEDLWLKASENIETLFHI